MTSRPLFITLMYVFYLLVIWQAIVGIFSIPAYLVPSPSAVGSVFVSDAAVLSRQSLYTVTEWCVGLFFSMLIGFAIALVCFSSSRAREVVMPFLIVSQSVPYLAFAPLLLIWLGLGMTPKIVLVVLSCSFPIALALEQGLESTRNEFRVIASMLKLSRTKAFFHAYLPGALPQLFTGLKLSASYAFVSTVMAELIGSESGLGVYMTRAQSSYRTDRVVAAVIVIICVSLGTTAFVDLLKRRIVFWNTLKK